MTDPRWGQQHSGGQPMPLGYPQQSNTGPCAPQSDTPYTSPFEEPEEAPELRDSRSENLYRRSEPFWDHVTTAQQPVQRTQQRRDPNYWNHEQTMADDRMLETQQKPRQKKEKLKSFLGSHAVWKALGLLAVFVIIAVVLCSALFEIRTIQVIGNTTVSAEEIIELSGLEPGMLTLAMNHEAVAERVERHRYLICTLVDVEWDNVTIHVHEREPAVYIEYNGIIIVTDNRGYVLEEKLNRTGQYEDLICVTGMDVRRCVLGQQLMTNSALQLETFTNILLELKAMKGLSMIKELDMSNMDSIYLETRDGFVVRLGDAYSIHQKLRAMMVVHQKLPTMDPLYTDGTIDVSKPATPTYDPTDEIKQQIKQRDSSGQTA